MRHGVKTNPFNMNSIKLLICLINHLMFRKKHKFLSHAKTQKCRSKYLQSGLELELQIMSFRLPFQTENLFIFVCRL